MHTIRLVLHLTVLVFIGLSGPAAAAEATAEPAPSALSVERVDSLLATLEDPQQRERLVEALRTLAQADAELTEREPESVKTAAADALALVAARVSTVSGSLSTLLDAAGQAPERVRRWANALGDPQVRQRWLSIGGRLAAVLGAGYLALLLVLALTRRLRRRELEQPTYSLLSRLGLLLGRLIVDLLPIAALGLAAYATLTAVDPREEVRYVAVALINASVLARLVMAASAFLVAPETPRLRLWRIGDETAHYIHHWVRRLSLVSIYGFFGLQAALLLGLELEAYRTLLRLLGLIVLGLLLVLVAQNREEVGRMVAGEHRAAVDEPARLPALRRGLARVWHLIAGLYLIAVYAIWALKIQNGAQYIVKATLVSLIVLAAAHLLMRGADRFLDRGLRLSDELRSRFPGLEQRLNRYFPLVRKIVKLVIVVAAVLLIAGAWGIDTLGWITEGPGRVLIGALFNILIIVLIALFLWELASGAIERYLADVDQQGRVRTRSARIRTLLTVARNALLVVLALVSTLMILSELGINIAPLLAGAGVVGLAIGFGAQRLVQDVINGVFILFQDLMSVGDVVKLGDKAGLVEALTIRNVRLRDLSGTVHTIPFSSIEAVSNLTREFSFHVFDLGIAYREDVDEVIALLKEIGEELRADADVGPLILEPLEVFGLDAFGDSAIVIKGRIKTQPIKQWQVGRAFNRLVKKRFDERGIEIPFPHRTLYFGAGKDGTAPPAYVQLESMLREAAPEAGVPAPTQ